MATIASRDLRNHTADVLRQVEAGGTVVVTVHGEPVAQISPVARHRRASLSRTELVAALASASADPALRDELAALVGDTTDDLADLA